MKDEYFWQHRDAANDTLLEECAALFSRSYGVWGDQGVRPGQAVELSPRALRKGLPEDAWILGARNGGALVGYGVGVRARTGAGTVAWVTQLVVHPEHRGRGIAKKLLLGFWGFSDHYAWGLVTSNPYAVAALESITSRDCDPQSIARNVGVLREAGSLVPYVREKEIDTVGRSAIDTKFLVSHRHLPKKRLRYEEKRPWRLGDIREGEEWLAFTFREQPIVRSTEFLSSTLRHSDEVLVTAYSRMRYDEQPWTRHAEHEARFAVSALGLGENSDVLDVGCGSGRHALVLSPFVRSVHGIDASPVLIDRARQRPGANLRFEQRDAREPWCSTQYSAAICLYDVVGSYAADDDNLQILRSIATALRPGARALISVMNWSAVGLGARVADVEANPELLFRLKPSDTMQRTGQIWDPAFMLLDEKRRLVYRKEQFDGDDQPPGEYVVRDRRYTVEDLRDLVERAGLLVKWIRPVSLGSWDVEKPPTDVAAKELLALLEKSSQ